MLNRHVYRLCSHIIPEFPLKKCYCVSHHEAHAMISHCFILFVYLPYVYEKGKTVCGARYITKEIEQIRINKTMMMMMNDDKVMYCTAEAN